MSERKGENGGDSRLSARPAAATPAEQTVSPGLHRLGIGSGERDGLLYVPRRYRPEHPAPLAVMLHGAGTTRRRA